MTLFVAHVGTGGKVSVTVTVSTQVEKLVQQSVAFQVMVMVLLHGPTPFVTALSMMTVGLEQQLSVADGGRMGEPHWTM